MIKNPYTPFKETIIGLNFMKIAHLTDLHYQSPPSFSDLWAPKRWIGSVNLYVRGRSSI